MTDGEMPTLENTVDSVSPLATTTVFVRESDSGAGVWVSSSSSGSSAFLASDDVPGLAVAVKGDSTRPGWLSPGSTRSEEHTSELQSLMRISYAVFCLTKKTTQLSYQ